MSDKYIEKSFLYLVALSLLIHMTVFAFFYFMPKEQHTVIPEPYMVELHDLPQFTIPQVPHGKETKRKSDSKFQVNKEIAPKGEMPRERVARPARSVPELNQQTPVPARRKSPDQGSTQEAARDFSKQSPRSGENLINKKEQLPELAKLYPSAGKLASLEENYRRKYGPEVEDGETKFLNTEDVLFGSFLRRFETAVYGVWSYPAEAVRLGIEGVTPVKITFNRKGEVENVQLLESSGSKILDDEVFRTLRRIGPVGSFPKGYGKESFNLIAFFQYGITRGRSGGVLR